MVLWQTFNSPQIAYLIKPFVANNIFPNFFLVLHNKNKRRLSEAASYLRNVLIAKCDIFVRCSVGVERLVGCKDTYNF